MKRLKKRLKSKKEAEIETIKAEEETRIKKVVVYSMLKKNTSPKEISELTSPPYDYVLQLAESKNLTRLSEPMSGIPNDHSNAIEVL